MIIEQEYAIGAAVLVFPEGAELQAGGTCSSAAIPPANDTGWIDTQRIEEWDFTRKDAKYEPVKDGSTGRLKLSDEVETDGYTEYSLTLNVILALLLGAFFRSGSVLNPASYQFNPDTGNAPRCWMMLALRDQNGNLLFAANIWGRLKYDKFSGGGGKLTKPAVTFTQYENNLNVASLGTN
jgi:hypothetical protein